MTDTAVRAGTALGTLPAGTIISDETVPARAPWSGVVVAGQLLSIVDLTGLQAVDCLLYDAGAPTERYSAPDTITSQRSVRVTTGTVLRSNESGALMTIIGDVGGCHDTLAGACSQAANTVRFGHHTRAHHACVENFLLEGAKWGLGRRDLVSTLNLFTNVAVEPDGAIGIVDGISQPGATVTLRAERDVLVLLSNCPQIHGPQSGSHPSPIRVVVQEPTPGA